MSFLQEIQAPAPIADAHVLKSVVILDVYNKIDEAFDRFPNHSTPEPFVLSEADIYRGQRLFLRGLHDEELVLSRPIATEETEDPGIRTAQVTAEDQRERAYLLGCTGNTLVRTTLYSGARLRELLGNYAVIPHLHAEAEHERSANRPEAEKAVQPIRTLEHAKALGKLIELAVPYPR